MSAAAACVPAAGVYKPRRPHASPLFRLVSDHFGAFHDAYEDRFAATYGDWRPVNREVAEKFLDCGVLAHGFARVRCGACTHACTLGFRAPDAADRYPSLTPDPPHPFAGTVGTSGLRVNADTRTHPGLTCPTRDGTQAPPTRRATLGRPRTLPPPPGRAELAQRAPQRAQFNFLPSYPPIRFPVPLTPIVGNHTTLRTVLPSKTEG